MFFQTKVVNGVCFFTALFMCQTALSNDSEGEGDESGWRLGLEVGVEQSIYKDEDDDVMYLPIIEYSGDGYLISLEGVELEKVLKRPSGQEFDFYSGLTFGLDDEPVEFEVGVGTSLINSKDLELYVSTGVILAIDEESRSEDDSSIFEGMDERVEDTDRLLFDLEVISNYGLFSLGIESDIGDTHDGSIYDVRYSAPLIDGDKAQLWMGIGVEFYDGDYVDYYYGVKSNEVTTDRPFYEGESASSPYVGYSFSYQMTKQWQFSHELRVKSVSDEMSESPLTEDDDMTVDGLISISYMLCKANCK